MNKDKFLHEIESRRTIISHPDAGKTTITEKYFVVWKCDQRPVQLKAKSPERAVCYVWLDDMEKKERGISVYYLGNAISLIITFG
jgi:peptide subunit release factor RF-3